MMFGLPSLYLRLAGYGVAALLIGGAGYKFGANHWETKYRTLQAADYEGLSQREQAARKALEGQLTQARAVSTNNAQVLHDLQTQTAAIVADRDRTNDLVHRLLTRQARPAASPVVSQAADQPGTARASEAGGDERLGELLGDAATECRTNAAQLNALIAQVKPQL
jgi:hypothetical protein